MTITRADLHSYQFFTMEESFRLTNFRNKKAGDIFNVERSLRLGDRIDGHMVSGHIDATGVVIACEKNTDNSLILGVQFLVQYADYIISK